MLYLILLSNVLPSWTIQGKGLFVWSRIFEFKCDSVVIYSHAILPQMRLKLLLHLLANKAAKMLLHCLRLSMDAVGVKELLQ